MTDVTTTETITITEPDGTTVEVSGPRGPQGASVDLSAYALTAYVDAADTANANAVAAITDNPPTFDMTSGVVPYLTIPNEIDYVTATAADAAYQGNIVVRNVAAIVRALEDAGIVIVSD